MNSEPSKFPGEPIRLAAELASSPVDTKMALSSATMPWPAMAELKTIHFVLCALHIPLAIVFYEHEQLAKLHSLATVAAGFWFAFRGKLEQCAYVVAYIVGAEVLWRMTGGGLVWEIGKYSTSAILLTALAMRRVPLAVTPVLYFAALFPSAVLTILEVDPALAKRYISFNLSAPLALMSAVCFFARIRMSGQQIRRLLLAAIAPILGVAAITITATLRASSIQFTTESNMVTSGGFGPNQVSSALGMGALLAFLLLLQMRSLKAKSFFLAVTIVFATQSMMTFSRSGIYMASAAAACAGLIYMRERRSQVTIAMAGLLFFATMAFVILPRLDSFTEGNLSARFLITDHTGREEVIRMQVAIWKERPILGVGPGLSKAYQQRWFKTSWLAHSEFSRMISEHGVFGLIAILILAMLALQAVQQTQTNRALALVVALLVFSGLYMSVNAMRVAAPSFLFGLAFLRESTRPSFDAAEDSLIEDHKESGADALGS